MKKTLLTSMSCLLLGMGAQANTITFNFLENGPGDLGSSTRSFTESGVTLTASSYSLPGNTPGPNLYAKTSGGDENGLGLLTTPDHEITSDTYIQLKVSTPPTWNLQLVFLGSVQSGELAKIYFSPTPGSLGTFITSIASDQSYDISSFGAGYIGITGGGTGGANVLIDSVTAEAPDGGTTIALLGTGLAALGGLRRKLQA